MTLPAAVLALAPHDWPRWAVMWTLSAAIFAGCKWLTWRRTPAPASWRRHVAYLAGWPGLDARAFLCDTAPVTRPNSSEWVRGAACLTAGAAMFFALARQIPARHELWAGWIGMIGLVLMLHFGSFHLLSCAWRSVGIAARPLMNRPLRSTSLAEFWGRRWNTAFRDFTHRFVFVPLTAALGPRVAIAVGFLLSGVVHDIVISIPAGGGYGGPTVFFGLQAVGIFVDRSRTGRRIGLGRGTAGRAFMMLLLAAPAMGLFHPPFVRNVIVPFMRAVHAY